MTASGRLLPRTKGSYGSIPAGQDVPSRWSHPMQSAGQVECQQVVKWDANAWSSQVQFPTQDTTGEIVVLARAKKGQKLQCFPENIKTKRQKQHLINNAFPSKPTDLCHSRFRIELVSHPLLDFDRVPTHSAPPNKLPLGKFPLLHQCVNMATPKPTHLLRLLEPHDPTNAPLVNHLNFLLAPLHFPTLTPLWRSMDSWQGKVRMKTRTLR